jgi:hypothetical protein
MSLCATGIHGRKAAKVTQSHLQRTLKAIKESLKSFHRKGT